MKTETLGLLRSELTEVRDEIAKIEQAKTRLKELHRAERKMSAAIAALEPEKPRARRGAAIEIMRRILIGGVSLNREQAIEAAETLAAKELVTVSRDSLSRAFVSINAIDDTVPHE
jgi:cell envelope opacity-associated protein A